MRFLALSPDATAYYDGLEQRRLACSSHRRPPMGYDEPEILSYAIRPFCPTSVDMAQSALGPGMGIFMSYAKVLEPDDSEMTVRTAIALINEVREEILGEEDTHYDPETRFCIDWFQAFGVG